MTEGTTMAAERLAEATEAIRHIIGAANEAPKFGPFDQIDNSGGYYQSQDFSDALNKGRKFLASIEAKESTHE